MVDAWLAHSVLCLPARTTRFKPSRSCRTEQVEVTPAGRHVRRIATVDCHKPAHRAWVCGGPSCICSKDTFQWQCMQLCAAQCMRSCPVEIYQGVESGPCRWPDDFLTVEMKLELRERAMVGNIRVCRPLRVSHQHHREVTPTSIDLWRRSESRPDAEGHRLFMSRIWKKKKKKETSVSGEEEVLSGNVRRCSCELNGVSSACSSDRQCNRSDHAFTGKRTYPFW